MPTTIQRVSFALERPHTPRVPHTVPHIGDFLKFLDANPGLWAVYHTYPTRNASHHKKRRLGKAFGHLGYEFATRLTPEGSKLYGRKLAHTLASHTEG